MLAGATCAHGAATRVPPDDSHSRVPPSHAQSGVDSSAPLQSAAPFLTRFPGHDGPRGRFRPFAVPPRSARNPPANPRSRAAYHWRLARVLHPSRGRAIARPGHLAADPAGQRRARRARCRCLLALRGAAPGHLVAVVEQGHRTGARGWAADPARGARHPHRSGRLAGRRVRPGRRGQVAARPDDAIAARFGRRCRSAVQRARPGPAAARAAGWAGAGQPRPGPGPGAGRDRLPARTFRRAGPRPGRRRADDVRPGQLRALPAQDLQCHLDHRRQAAGALAVPHDQAHPPADPAAHLVGLQRQRGGGGRRAGCALSPGSGHRPIPQRSGAAVGVCDQGGNA